MEEFEHKEIDVLLKKLGQSETQGPIEISSPHLDADELSAFAEQSLPDGARAFYATHLADCDECRKLVINLSRVSGRLVEKSDPSVKGASLLATIFSFHWLNLRFAIPSLAAIAVLVISIVVIRHNQKSELVSQVANSPSLMESRPSIVAAPTANEAQKVNRPSSSPAAASGRADATAPVHETSSNGSLARDQAKPEDRQPQIDKVEKQQDAEVASKPAAKTEQPEAAPPPKAADQISTTKEEAAQDQPTVSRSVVTLDDKASSRERKKAQEAPSAAAPARQEPGSSAGASGNFVIGGMRRAANEKGKDSASETRTVAGHHFRREGKIWIDERYQSGTSAIDIVRGSEQFRALTADEPDIATVADQLNGEIIVVWKGHAYHIKG